MTEQRVIPMLAYEDASRAADWICKVFGFREAERFHDGVVVYIDDVDTHFGRSKRGGAKILSEPESNERQRQYRVEDLEGHRWMFAQRLGG